jgi:hypothetical protein
MLQTSARSNVSERKCLYIDDLICMSYNRACHVEPIVFSDKVLQEAPDESQDDGQPLGSTVNGVANQKA